MLPLNLFLIFIFIPLKGDSVDIWKTGIRLTIRDRRRLSFVIYGRRAVGRIAELARRKTLTLLRIIECNVYDWHRQFSLKRFRAFAFARPPEFIFCIRYERDRLGGREDGGLRSFDRAVVFFRRKRNFQVSLRSVGNSRYSEREASG